MKTLLKAIAVFAFVVNFCSCAQKHTTQEPVVFKQSAGTSVTVAAGTSVDLELALNGQNKIAKLEGYDKIGKGSQTLFLTTGLSNEANTFTGSYFVPANTPSGTKIELKFKLYDENAPTEPVKISNLIVAVQ